MCIKNPILYPIKSHRYFAPRMIPHLDLLDKMKYKKINKTPGSEVQYDPRLVGDILSEMLSSDSPLAKGYRKHLASIEINAEKGDKLYV